MKPWRARPLRMRKGRPVVILDQMRAILAPSPNLPRVCARVFGSTGTGVMLRKGGRHRSKEGHNFWRPIPKLVVDLHTRMLTRTRAHAPKHTRNSDAARQLPRTREGGSLRPRPSFGMLLPAA